METIYKNSENFGGIYKIYNKINNRFYIGSTKKFINRYKQHTRTLENKKHSNKFLQAEYEKFGSSNFVFEVLEIINNNKDDKIFRLSIEQKYLDQCFDKQKKCYNLSSKALLTTEDIKHKKESCLIKSELLKKRWEEKEYRNKMSGINHSRYNKPMPENVKNALVKSLFGNKHFFNKKLSEAAKKKISEKNKGKTISDEQRKNHSLKMKGKKLSIETKKKISISNKGRKHSLLQKKRTSDCNSKLYDVKIISNDGQIFGPIKNLRKFCLKHKLIPQKMYLVIKKTSKQHKGWKLL